MVFSNSRTTASNYQVRPQHRQSFRGQAPADTPGSVSCTVGRLVFAPQASADPIWIEINLRCTPLPHAACRLLL
jgi:hypothetical protein